MKVLFLGLGGVGQRHLRNFDKLTFSSHEYYTLSRGDFRPIITDTLELIPSNNLFDSFPFQFIDKLDDIYALQPDITFISTPSSFHFEHASIALKAKSHVYLEKPAVLSVEELNKLISLRNIYNKKISVVSQFRFNPLIKKLSEILNSSIYGNILFADSVVSEYMPNWHKYENYKRSYASRSDLGGGVVLTQIHEIDYLYYLFGDLEISASFDDPQNLDRLP